MGHPIVRARPVERAAKGERAGGQREEEDHILDREGQILLQRNLRSRPEAFLEAVAPFRDDLVVAVECIFTWYWLADGRSRCSRSPIQVFTTAEMRRTHFGGEPALFADLHGTAFRGLAFSSHLVGQPSSGCAGTH